MQTEIDSSEQERVKLLVKKAELEAECAKLKAENAEYIKIKAEITKLKAEFINSIKKDYADFEAHIVKLKHLSLEQPDRLESIEAMIIEINLGVPSKQCKLQNRIKKNVLVEYASLAQA